MGRGRAVQAARVRGAEDDVLRHERDDLRPAAGSPRVTLRDVPRGDDLAGELREEVLGAVPAPGGAALGAGLRGDGLVAVGVAAVLAALPPGAVAGVVVATAEADRGAEHHDDLLLGVGRVARVELGLARLGRPDLGEQELSRHHPRVGVVAGVATLLLLAQRDAAALTLVGGRPQVLAALGARHLRRVAHRQNATLTAPTLLADDDGIDVDARTLEVDLDDLRAFRNLATADGENAVRSHLNFSSSLASSERPIGLRSVAN